MKEETERDGEGGRRKGRKEGRKEASKEGDVAIDTFIVVCQSHLLPVL